MRSDDVEKIMGKETGRLEKEGRKQGNAAQTEAELSDTKEELKAGRAVRKSQLAANKPRRCCARLTEGLMKEANKSHGDTPPRPSALNKHATAIDPVAARMETFNLTRLWVFKKGRRSLQGVRG